MASTPAVGSKRGRGRPRLGPEMTDTGLSLPVALAQRLRDADPKGQGKLAAGLRALVEELDHLAAALRLACSDLLSVDRAEGEDTTPARLAADYVEIAKTEAWERTRQPQQAARELAEFYKRGVSDPESEV